jgi:hypothetical protein
MSADVAPTRRCWRCLEQFACETADLPVAGPPEWWLCERCHGTLIPAR